MSIIAADVQLSQSADNRRFHIPIACERALLLEICGQVKPRENPERLALVLNQILYVYDDHNDQPWLRLTYKEWQTRWLKWLTERQIREAIRDLVRLGYLAVDEVPMRQGFLVCPTSKCDGTNATRAVNAYVSPSTAPGGDAQGRALNVVENKDLENKKTTPSKIQLREQQLLPLAKRCIEVVAKARGGLVPIKQNEEEAVKTIRLAIDSDKIPEQDILPLAQWMFNINNPSLEFNIDNLSLVHNWRNRWKTGTAIVVRHTQWKRSGGSKASPETDDKPLPQYCPDGRRGPGINVPKVDA